MRLRSGLDVKSEADGTPRFADGCIDVVSVMVVSSHRAAPIATGIDERPEHVRP